MPNNILKQRENKGWQQLRTQLDVEMPAEKKEDRKLIWLFLFAGFSIVSVTWLTLQQRPRVDLQYKKEEEIKPLEPMAGESIKESKPIAPAIKDQTDLAKLSTTRESSTKSSSVTKNKIPSNSKQQIQKQVTTSLSQSNSVHKAQVGALPIESSLNESISEAKSGKNLNSEVINPSIQTGKDSMTDRGIMAEKTKMLPQENSNSGKIEDVKEVSTLSIIDSNVSANPAIPHKTEIGIEDVRVVTEMETPITLDPVSSKLLRGMISFGTDYSSDHFYSAFLLGGKTWPVTGKFYLNGQVGVGFQFNKTNTLILGSASQSSVASGKNFDVNNSSVFSAVNANKILLDQSRAISGFRGDTLVLSANDQIQYQSRNQWMALIQTGLGYKINSFWSIESGIHFKTYLNSAQDLLAVNYAPGINNGFNTSGTSIYKLNASTAFSQWSWYINTGLSLNKNWAIQAQYNTLPFIFKSGGQQAESLNGVASGSHTGQILSLPVKQNSSYVRFSLQFRF